MSLEILDIMMAYKMQSHDFKTMLQEASRTDEYSDVTLVTEDQIKIKCHRLLLSSCSSLFKNLFTTGNGDQNGYTVFLDGVNFEEMDSILQFIYCGQSIVKYEKSDTILNVARSLQINCILSRELDIRKKVDEVQREDKKNNLEVTVKTVNSEDKIAKMNVDFEHIMCLECRSTFKSKSSLTNHYKNKHMGIKYDCDKCNMKFSVPSSLYTHKKSLHSDTEEKSCEQCPYKTSRIDNLKTHIEAVHESKGLPYEKQFQCSKCDFRTVHKGYLRSHLQTVHGSYNVMCNQCNFKALTQIQLNNHIKFEHEGIRFPCNECKYEAKTQTLLKKHFRTQHEGFTIAQSQ